MPDSKNETLKKLINSRDKWKERSNTNQFEKRRLEDKVRYLKKRLEMKSDKISKLNEELKKNGINC